MFFFFFQVGHLEFVLLALLSIDVLKVHFPKKKIAFPDKWNSEFSTYQASYSLGSWAGGG